MAFPNDITPFLPATDPTNATDINNILTYQNMLSAGDISGAQQFLMNLSNGIQMSLNAGRYNQVIDAIVEIEKFYSGLNGVKEYILRNSSAFTNYKQWNSTYNYSVGNFVGYNNSWYSCIKENTNIEPTVATNWEQYWQLILQPQPAKQVPIQGNTPIDQLVGDLWFEWGDDPTPKIDPIFGNNTPAAIKYAFDNNIVPSTWNTGDEITIRFADGAQTSFVLYDKQRGRYTKSNGIGKTNAVLGIKNCYALQKAGMLSGETTDVTGGWAQSSMRGTVDLIYAKMFPSEWQAVISEVKVPSTINPNSDEVGYSDNYLFLPAYNEISVGTTMPSLLNEGTTFDYFLGETVGRGSAKRVKEYAGTNTIWWTRSIMPSNDTFECVGIEGAINVVALPYTKNGIAFCFAI